MGEATGNLDVRGQNAQLRLGVAVIAVALCAATFLVRYGAPVSYRGLLWLPFFVGTYGVYAGLTRTCGIMGIRGERTTAVGSTPVADRKERLEHRRRGLQVIFASASIAALATILLVFAH